MTWPTKDDFVDGDVLTAAQVNNIADNLNEIDPTGITDGYVVTADGAGGLGWEAVSADSWTLITQTSMSGVSTFTWNSIPGTYQELVAVFAGVQVAGTFEFYFNNDTTDYYNNIFRMTHLQTYANNQVGFSNRIGAWSSNTSATGLRVVRIPAYAGGGYKVCQLYQAHNASTMIQETGNIAYNSTSAISRIDIYSNANFSAGTAYLYGVK